MTQEQVVALILKSEGGLNENEPTSVGGVSFAGITQKTYDAYLARIRESLPNAPDRVRALENYPLVINAFYSLYLGDFNVWILPDFLQYAYADFVVNAGAAAVKIIQKMCEVEVDGVFGSGTRKAVTEWTERVKDRLAVDPSVDNNLIMEFHNAKLEHYDRLVAANPSKFKQYHEGWKRRANHVLSELGEYFETDEGTPSAMDVQDVPVAPVTTSDTGGTDVPADFDFLALLQEVNDLNVRVSKLENAKKWKG